MGIRPSDARWIERDVIPLLESVGAALKPPVVLTPDTMFPQTYTYSTEAAANYTAQRAALVTQLAETTAQAKRRIEGRRHDPFGEHYRLEYLGHGNAYRAIWDGYPVPYVTIEQVGGLVPTPNIDTEVSDETPTYKITLDGPGSNRHGGFSNDPSPLTADELYPVLFLLAHGMAIAAGFTCHGPHSFPRNAHGPAVGLAPFTVPEPAKPAMTQDMVIRWLEAWRDQKVIGNDPQVKRRIVAEILDEMIESQRGSVTFPGWPFDLDPPVSEAP